MGEARHIEEMLGETETKLERLRALYEQYFQGIERTEPQLLRTSFERMMAVLLRQQTRNTALRFRVQNLQQRYTTLKTYWSRVLRQIEEGTYRPHRVRAKRLYEADKPAPGDRQAVGDRPAAGDRQGATPAHAAAARTNEPPQTRPGAASGGQVPLDHLHELHAKFVHAQTSHGAAPIAYATLERKVQALLPDLRRKHGDRDLRFDVVVKNGKVGLRLQSGEPAQRSPSTRPAAKRAANPKPAPSAPRTSGPPPLSEAQRSAPPPHTGVHPRTSVMPRNSVAPRNSTAPRASLRPQTAVAPPREDGAPSRLPPPLPRAAER